jgi:hypothetical protein
MSTLQHAPAKRTVSPTRKSRKPTQLRPTAVTAERVKEMLLEIAFVLHATRVVRRMGEDGLERGTEAGPAAADPSQDGHEIASSLRQTSTT